MLRAVPAAAQLSPPSTSGLTAVSPPSVPLQAAAYFEVSEASIAEIHSAVRSGELSARALVANYLDRIAAYDRAGPYLNSLVTVNSAALDEAEELDRMARAGRFVGSLHGIPVIVKDNIDTAELPTSAGSRALEGTFADDDAEVVRRLRAAGAIVLAKANMSEFAMRAAETISSSLPGYTFNPYSLNRVTGGSSGGSAAAVAANLGAVAIGTDTYSSIRGPAAHTSLVGFRPTHGLVPTDGIVPLDPSRDVVGPIARSVTDVALLMDVLAPPGGDGPGGEPSPATFAGHLRVDGLREARIGVIRTVSNAEGGDPEVMSLFAAALEDLRRAGAEVLDPLVLSDWATMAQPNQGCVRLASVVDEYLATRSPELEARTLEEIVQAGLIQRSAAWEFTLALDAQGSPEATAAACRTEEVRATRVRAAVDALFEQHELDALVYPSWSFPPRLLDDLLTPAGSNSLALAPPTGYPAITVPMGYTHGGLPAGIEFLARANDDGPLLAMAFAYEQATRHRHPPTLTPPLGPGWSR